MILQALKDYYDRRAAEKANEIAPEGFEWKPIPFLIILSQNGSFVELRDTRERVEKRTSAKRFLLPRSSTRTGVRAFEKPFLLWDHAGFLLGLPKSDEKAFKQHRSWLQSLGNLPPSLKADPGIFAVIKFYQLGEIEKVQSSQLWPEIQSNPSCNLTFQIVGNDLPVPCSQVVKDLVVSQLSQLNLEEGQPVELGGEVLGRCLITGEWGKIVRTHGRTPIDKDTKSLVAIQRNSGYDSYGKEQCFNAPISRSAEFAYVEGLNALLRSTSQRLQVGNTTVVFWAEKSTRFEEEAELFFSEPPPDNPHANSALLKALYSSIWDGNYSVPDESTRFFVLGLSPNSARISVRFWETGTVKDMGCRLVQHVRDLQIVNGPREDRGLPLSRLFAALAMQKGKRKSPTNLRPFAVPHEKLGIQKERKNIPPNIVGETVRAILNGNPYPLSLVQGVLRRIRAEHEVTYPRAALLKACLNRLLRFSAQKTEKEIKMSLDLTNSNIGYRLGRLFALLEKIQGEAQGSTNSTIRDRFYGAASGTPITVFGNLMRLKNHHLSKLPDGLRITREKQLQEVVSGIPSAGFPSHLSMGDQGRFAIGYYHQMQFFYSKMPDSTESEKE